MKDLKQIIGKKAGETKRKALSDLELLQIFLSSRKMQMVTVKTSH